MDEPKKTEAETQAAPSIQNAVSQERTKISKPSTPDRPKQIRNARIWKTPTPAKNTFQSPFDIDVDRYRKLLDPCKVTKELLQLVQKSAIDSQDIDFSFGPTTANHAKRARTGYIVIAQRLLEPMLLKIIPMTGAPYEDLPTDCREGRSGCQYSKSVWIKTKCVQRVSESIHLELLKYGRKPRCPCLSQSVHYGGLWFEISMEEGLKVVERWIDWMDQDPYFDNGELKPQYRERSTMLLKDLENHRKGDVERNWSEEIRKAISPNAQAQESAGIFGAPSG